MENNRKQQIEIARQRVIKRRWLKRMADFEVFQSEVYTNAKKVFGEIPNEVRVRLEIELNGIKNNNRLIMLATMASVMRTLEDKGISSKLSLKDGYNVSLVCYLLGISAFNPMKHLQLITETYVIKIRLHRPHRCWSGLHLQSIRRSQKQSRRWRRNLQLRWWA